MSDQDEGQVPATPRSTPRSSGSSISPSTSSTTSSGSAKSAVSECLGAWLNYLQMVNNLCAAGYRLNQTITSLEGWSLGTANSSHISSSASMAWENLAKATNIATATVKSHVISILQDFITQSLSTYEAEAEQQRAREHNQYVVNESFQTMLNLQHQFCVASCDSFAQYFAPNDPEMAAAGGFMGKPMDLRSQTPSPHFAAGELVRYGSTSTQASDHCTTLEQLRDIGYLDQIRGPLPAPGQLASKFLGFRGSRSPLNFPLFPLNGQRRWSETAAVQSSGGEDPENQARRWSMPWENKSEKSTRVMPISKLAIQSSKGQPPPPPDRSQSITPDSSVDAIQQAIQLLSCRPVRAQHSLGAPFIEEPPGTSTGDAPFGIWSARPQLKFVKEQDPKQQYDDSHPT